MIWALWIPELMGWAVSHDDQDYVLTMRCMVVINLPDYRCQWGVFYIDAQSIYYSPQNKPRCIINRGPHGQWWILIYGALLIWIYQSKIFESLQKVLHKLFHSELPWVRQICPHVQASDRSSGRCAIISGRVRFGPRTNNLFIVTDLKLPQCDNRNLI